MDIESLPDEILLLIIKMLDETCTFNVYIASPHIKNIIQRYGIIKKIKLSCNTLSHVATFQSDFFKDISPYLLELNVCGMSNLCKSSLFPALKRLKSLRSLDVSYTNMTLLDLLEMYDLCPSIKNVCIDFKFGKSIKLAKNTLLQCQTMFANFENVHLIGNHSNLIFSNTVMFIMSKAVLKNLQFTITENEAVVYENEECPDVPHFDYFQICFAYSSMDIVNNNLYKCTVLNNLQFENYEFVFIFKLDEYMLYTSPIFLDFFIKKFKLEVRVLKDFDILLRGNVGVYLWNKKSTTFDKYFFDYLYRKLKHFFICYTTEPEDILHYKWFCLKPNQQNVENDEKFRIEHWMKKRMAPSAYVLNYDIFKEKDEVELNLMFSGDIKTSVTLSSQNKYLHIITYLNLSGNVKYSTEFFNILFRCCQNLVTLLVEAPETSPYCAASISRSIPLSHTLKNFCLIDKRIDFVVLLSSFSQCKALENVQLKEYLSDNIILPDPTVMFQKCANLYCLNIYYGTTLKSHSKHLLKLNNAKKLSNKPFININVQKISEFCYSPFTDVFRLCAIKPIML